MNNNIKKTVNFFKKKYKLKKINFLNLKKVAVEMGYTIIEFNSSFNDVNIETILKNLNLDEFIVKSRGFTYVNQDYRLIFINENLNDDEKTLVISHELGHIICGHLSTAPVIGNDVKEEYAANEFTHYLLNPGISEKMKNFIFFHRRSFVVAMITLILISSSFIVYSLISDDNKYKEDFYITATGKKYHKEECIYVKDKNNVKEMTKKQFESGMYSPCNVCLSENN